MLEPHAAAWARPEGQAVRCELCPHRCLVREGGFGLCRVRGVKDGIMRNWSYGRLSAVALDPVEKKPLFHLRPGCTLYSIGSYGCNMRCAFCQNAEISQVEVAPGETTSPLQVVQEAQTSQAAGIAYTYNEPAVNYEFVLACAKQAKSAGLLNVMVTNGYLAPGPLAELLPWIDAWNIDLKAFFDTVYKTLCGARLQPVQETISRVRAAGSHVEITHLVVTEGNVDEAAFLQLVDWIAELGVDIPLHLTRFTPRYRHLAPATSVELLERWHQRAKKKLNYVYLGNVPGRREDTFCPQCDALLIKRAAFLVQHNALISGRCPQCGHTLPGIF
jgi:pyruvate formate lyase activating enzyme